MNLDTKAFRRAGLLALLVATLVGCSLQSAQDQPLPTPTQVLLEGDAPLKWQDPAWLRNFPVQARTAIAFDHLSLQDGLSQSVVTAIAQDPRGFLSADVCSLG